ncbi:unnamed protein product [Schistosoma curassoni]|uniref:Na_H_Exchanger domain-containing protein n=1 Tax=Schistosoma curassoni TaxID=6186 RepID=A0A183L477_9TREM|nr:unnamed protein product [Schistosoma curassoni]
MIFIGDGAHNFMDGLSIGVGFTQSIGLGISLTLAVLCEELPHELGKIIFPCFLLFVTKYVLYKV